MAQFNVVGGNSVTIKIKLTDSVGALVDFDIGTPLLVIYDSNRVEKSSQTNFTRLSTGRYTIVYLTERVDIDTIIYYEISGQVSGETVLTKDSIYQTA
jgi:hypothetical protein